MVPRRLFLRSQFESVKRWRALEFTDGPYVGFERSLDMFKDGSVVLVPLAGHTAGHTGMFLNLPSGKRYFFTGDVAPGPRRASTGLRMFQGAASLGASGPRRGHEPGGHRAVAWDSAALPGCELVPAHDENVMKTLPQFPVFEE